MKLLKNILAILFVLPTVLCSAQSGEAETRHYQIVVECPIYECNILGEKISDSIYVTPINAIFTKIEDFDSDFIVIRFWEWKTEKHKGLNDEFHNQPDKPSSKKYFLLSKKLLSLNALPYKKGSLGFLIGSTALPLKIRYSPFEFSTDYHLGHLIGARYKVSSTKDNYVDFFGAFGMTHITLDSISTNGTLNDNEAIRNTVAITPSIGIAFEFNNIMVGCFAGMDFLNSREKIDWIHHGQAWFSVGVGISFIGNSNKSDSSEGHN